MNSSTIHGSICSLLHKKSHPKSFHSDIKYHMQCIIVVSKLLDWVMLTNMFFSCNWRTMFAEIFGHIISQSLVFPSPTGYMFDLSVSIYSFELVVYNRSLLIYQFIL